MKRKDLEELGLTKEQIDSVMGIHGEDIKTHQTNIANLTTERDTTKTQLEDANKQIEGFKGMKTQEEVDAAVNEYKTKYEQAQADHAKNLAQVKFDHALEGALTAARVKNVKTVLPLLNREKLILQDDGTITGLDDQLKPIKEKEGYLFSDTKQPPRFSDSTQTQAVPDKGTFAGAIQERLNSTK